jgi:hypothetical protein
VYDHGRPDAEQAGYCRKDEKAITAIEMYRFCLMIRRACRDTWGSGIIGAENNAELFSLVDN